MGHQHNWVEYFRDDAYIYYKCSDCPQTTQEVRR